MFANWTSCVGGSCGLVGKNKIAQNRIFSRQPQYSDQIKQVKWRKKEGVQPRIRFVNDSHQYSEWKRKLKRAIIWAARGFLHQILFIFQGTPGPHMSSSETTLITQNVQHFIGKLFFKHILHSCILQSRTLHCTVLFCLVGCCFFVCSFVLNSCAATNSNT